MFGIFNNRSAAMLLCICCLNSTYIAANSTAAASSMAESVDFAKNLFAEGEKYRVDPDLRDWQKAEEKFREILKLPYTVANEALKSKALYRLSLMKAKLQAEQRAQALAAISSSVPAATSESEEHLHMPLSMLFDQDRIEQLSTGNPAVTVMLLTLLEQNKSVILVQTSLVNNVFHRFSPKIEQNWLVFDIPDSPLLLFVPKNLEDVAGQIFHLESFTNISSKFPDILMEHDKNFNAWLEGTRPEFVPDANLMEQSKELSQFLNKPNKQTVFGSNKDELSITGTFSFIFKKKTSENITLDILLNGHGSERKKFIAGLPVTEVPKLLDFFNKNVSVHILLILSCSAGGANLNVLEFDTFLNKEPVMRALNFTIIVASVTDQIIGMPVNPADYLETFFSSAAHLTDRGKSLDVFLSSIAQLNDTFGITRYPQIWFPHGQGFQTFNIDKNVFILGNVALQSHMVANKPIEITNKQAVLLYPEVIRPTVIINAAKLQTDWGKRYPNMGDWTSEKKASWANFMKTNNVIITDLPALSEYYNAGYEFSAGRFPQIISMIRGDATHLFDSIELLPFRLSLYPESALKSSEPGVLTFIQDAFFSDLRKRASRKTFLIKALTGFNDLHTLYSILKLGNPDNTFPALASIIADTFKIKEQDTRLNLYASDPITLERVIASSWTTSTPEPENAVTSHGTLSFEINGTAWEYVPDDAAIFKQKDLVTHRAEFEEKAKEVKQSAKAHIHKIRYKQGIKINPAL